MTARRVDAQTCKRAEAYVTHAGRWVSAKELGEFLGVSRELAGMAMSYQVAHGVIERRRIHGGNGGSRVEWRLRPEHLEMPPKFFNADWPPGFVSKFSSVVVPSFEVRRK